MTKPRRLLALDAAGAACSAALWLDGAIAARRLETMRRGQSERLVPMIQDVMSDAAADFSSLDAIATSIGPGGFTGVRIGLSTARGLALAWDLPLIGVTNFEAVAAAVPASEIGDRWLVVLLDAKRAEVYVQAFDGAGQAVAAPALVAPETLDCWLPQGALLLAGDASAQARPALQAAGRSLGETTAAACSDAVWVAHLAAARALPPSEVPAPLYLRQPDVTLPAGGARDPAA